MKVLFLDFDGVITCVNGSYAKEGMMDPPSLARLQDVARRTGCSIVVSSSWRHGRTLQDLSEIIRLPVIGKTPGDGEIFTHDHDGRGACILQWLMEHGEDVEHWAIVDDDVFDMHPWMLSRIVQCETGIGLTAKRAEELVYMLGEA